MAHVPSFAELEARLTGISALISIKEDTLERKNKNIAKAIELVKRVHQIADQDYRAPLDYASPSPSILQLRSNNKRRLGRGERHLGTTRTLESCPPP